jgi:hypothetical protein
VWGRELSEEVERIRKREERLKKEEEDRKVCRSVRGGGGSGQVWTRKHLGVTQSHPPTHTT